MFPSTLSFIHQRLKVLPLVLNLVESELQNTQEGGEEGSVVVFWQPTSCSLTQRERLTVREWVRRISLDCPFPLGKLPFFLKLPLAELHLPLPFSGEQPWLDGPWFPLACRSLLAVTAFTFLAVRRLAIFMHLFDWDLGQIFAGFLDHSFRIGLILPVILRRMHLGTVSVTEGPKKGHSPSTVCYLHSSHSHL